MCVRGAAAAFCGIAALAAAGDALEEAEAQPSFLQSLSDDWELSGYWELEGRGFLRGPAAPGQASSAGHGSVAVEPELYREWMRGDLSLTAQPFFRLDARDDERTHFDLREFSVRRFWDAWELEAGVGKVFWGVAESQHLVDVVNQTDAVENIDGEDKLGQPMVKLTWSLDWGDLEAFYLPYFRERTFPGARGRLRFQPRVDADRASYESGLEQWHPDAALRWSNAIGEVDIGVYYFRGTSRDPVFDPIIDGRGVRLAPVYNLMHQGGIDAQWTRDGWLLKFEGLIREGRRQRFQALVAGFEYTFYGLNGSAYDLGVIGEFHYNSDGLVALTPFDEDVFLGGRLTWNDEADTALLGGVVWDPWNSTSSARLEFERRLGDVYTVALEATLYFHAHPRDPLFFFREDSFAQIVFRRYF